MEQQAYAQPQFVMMPVAQRNGLGVFGFFVALIGLVIPTGLVALLGLVLSLAAIGRAPRGFASFGVILGVIGTVIWAAIMIGVVVVGLVAALAAAVAGAGAFVLLQPEAIEITGDYCNIALAVEEYDRENDGFPADIAALSLGTARTIDPWGTTYRLVLSEKDPGFDIISGGPDGRFETDDDVRLSRLDRYWEDTLEGFEDRMDAFGDRMERLGDHNIHISREGSAYEVPARSSGWYEDAARDVLQHTEVPTPDPVPDPLPAPAPAPVPEPTDQEDAEPADSPAPRGRWIPAGVAAGSG